MEKLKDIAKIIIGFSLLLLIVGEIFLIVDFFKAIFHPEEYQLGEYNTEYGRKSLSNYLIISAIILLCNSALIIGGVYAYKWKNKWVSYSFLVVLLVLLIKIIIGYREWAAPGFDH